MADSYDGSVPEPVFRPVADVYEVEGVFIVRLALPGVLEEDIDISLGRGTITIRGELERPVSADRGSSIVAEWCYGVFERCIRLPAEYEEQGLRVHVDGGVLEIRVPRLGG